MSKREAARTFELDFRTIKKTEENETPPAYKRESGVTKSSPFILFIQEILAADKKVSSKQRHSCKRIYERLRDEHSSTAYRTNRMGAICSLYYSDQLKDYWETTV
ncbi:MAG: hypothetical protein ACRC2T_07235 [Thermoguttaceae bacterium]